MASAPNCRRTSSPGVKPKATSNTPEGDYRLGSLAESANSYVVIPSNYNIKHIELQVVRMYGKIE
jgi:hypothetical protein